MRIEEVRRLYDEQYAASYEAKFLTSDLVAPDTAFEIELLRDFLRGDPEWLDVACGTGYFLRHFPHIRRTGLDASPAMLDRARQSNPGAAFVMQDFRECKPEWMNRFGLVSCMWYAYTLVDTIAEIVAVIDNLAQWTSPTGTCFLPIGDARLIARSNLPYYIEHPGGRLEITGILWSFIENDGTKVHAHLVTPQIEFIVEQFERHFKTVEVIRYPHKPDGVNGRPALIARNKHR